jgi:hypothetical protein
LKTFKSSELKTFEQLASLSQHSLKRVLSSFLKKHYPKVIETKDYIYTEGEIPVALVAHMDTVFKKPPEEIFFDERHNVMWSPQGLGADDRAGVFAIIQLIRSGMRPHIIFTTDEEKGAIGATKLAKLDCPFSKLKYLIQLDRRGSDDCVFYDCDNKEFVDYVEDFGFNYNIGSFTDISELCPSWEVAGVNLSVGYRNEHSETEVLFVGQLLSTISKVKKMLEAAERAPEFKYIPAVTRPYSTNWYSWGNGIYAAYGYDDNQILKCHNCKKYFLEEEMFPVVMLDKTTEFYCPDCVVDSVAWCNECNSAFQKYSPEAPQTGICPICKELEEKKADDKLTEIKG